nr:hypothetical protein [Bacteroidales bacterium]
MKMFYLQKNSISVSTAIQKLLVGLLLLAIPVMLNAQSVSGTSKCENGPLTINVINSVAGQWYILYNYKPDGSWDGIQAVAGSGGTLTFGTTPSEVGQYLVYNNGITYPGSPIPDTDPEIQFPSGTFIQGNLWIFANPLTTPKVKAIDDTYTIGAGGELVICADEGQIQITVESTPSHYSSDWDVNYQLYNGVTPIDVAKSAASGILTWTGLAAGTYTIQGYRGDISLSCDVVMDDEVVLVQGDIKNETTGYCYLTIQEAIDDADENDDISIPEGSYNETLDVEENIQFSSDGALTFTSNITVSNGHILTLNTDVEIQGTLDLTAATDQLILGANTLTLNGDWTGSGSIGIDQTSDLELYGTVSALNFAGTAISNLTINGENFGLVLLSDLSVHGALTIEDDLEIAGNTL